jgi:hypothetical protein
MRSSARTTNFRLVDGPRHVLDPEDAALVAHYEASFSTAEGESFERFLTDKGRGEMLRRVDQGQRTFSQSEIEDFTVPSAQGVLESRTESEGGEGG